MNTQMDIKKFLSSGTTHVHTTEPNGNFSKSAKAVVLSLALAAPSLASQAVQADISNVGEMPLAGDGVSLIYQALASPDPSANLRIVSTRSQFVLPMLQALPERLKDVLNRTPDEIAQANSITPGTGAYANSVGGKSWRDTQSICLVNALEEVKSLEVTAGHLTYVPVDSFGTKDIVSNKVVISSLEAGTLITLHELQHCTAFREMESKLPADTGDTLTDAYAVAFSEAAADLSIVLYYASKEGSFDNGRLAVGAIRSRLNNYNHATVDMVDMALSEYNPKDFVGMATHEVFSAATQIMDDLNEHRGQELKAAFLRETYETSALIDKLNGAEWSPAVAKAIQQSMASFIDQKGFPVNEYARADKLINQVLNNAARNPDLNRTVGAITVQSMQDLANQLGVQLSPEQTIKARFVDPEFSPPGTKGTIGFDSMSHLKEVNYQQILGDEAKQNIKAKMINSPRFN